MHVSSPPGEFGIGNLGRSARIFIDYLSDAGFQYWQICPIGPTGYGDSPYQSFSSFAGNPYFLDLDALCDEGLLEASELDKLRGLPDNSVDYGRLYQEFWPIIETAHQRFKKLATDSYRDSSFSEFTASEANWLDGFATYMALKAHYGGRPWLDWEEAYRNLQPAGYVSLPRDIQELARSHKFYQFLFFCQWRDLAKYAHQKGIRIIGDLPIFVPLDSADTWQFKKIFRLDEDGSPLAVAGVPPDYFSDQGQLWGNPLYDWEYLKSTGYSWWIDRLKAAFRTCDVLRLDHFRAFDSYWEIPSGSTTARSGVMRQGPGIEFFNTISGELNGLRIIAEDLGYITRGTVDLRREAGFPGMKILQFGYGHDDNNVNLPHFYPMDSVVYTGTHDNDTTRGWLTSLNGKDSAKVRRYYRIDEGDYSAWPVIEAGFASVSRLAIIPCQDLLDLGSEARMNRPGTLGDNWKWRITGDQMHYLKTKTVARLKQLHTLYDRTGDQRQREFSAPPMQNELKHH